MLKFLIVGTLFVTVLSAPLESSGEDNPLSHIQKIRRPTTAVAADDEHLSRPSPINPNIPSEPKPEEHLIPIDDIEDATELDDTTDEIEHPPSIHAYEKQTESDDDDAGDKIDEKTIEQLPVKLSEPSADQLPEDYKRSKRDAPKSLSSNAKESKEPVPITLGEPTIAQPPPGYKHVKRAVRDNAPKSSATLTKEVKTSVPITLGEPTIAYPPPGYKHVKREVGDNPPKSSATVTKEVKTSVPITLGEPTIAYPPPGYKHVKRSVIDDSDSEPLAKFETSHHIPAHVQLEQKHETIDNPAEQLTKETKETEEKNESIPAESLQEEKKNKRETNIEKENEETDQTDVLVAVAEHLLQPNLEILAPHKRDISAGAESNEKGPHFIRPVPVDQILKHVQSAHNKDDVDAAAAAEEEQKEDDESTTVKHVPTRPLYKKFKKSE